MKFIIALSLIVWCCSCNTFQYITVSSTEVKQDSLHRFVYENDSLKLVYNFNGRSGPVEITIFNKLDKPLVMDLNRSSLIINDKAVSFYTGQMQLSGIVNGTNTRWRNGLSTDAGVIRATATLPAGLVFIPAGSYIKQSPLVIADRKLANIGPEQFHLERYMANGYGDYYFPTAGFTKEASPLVFKTYLTFVQPDADKKEFVQQQSFYVSEVIQTSTTPDWQAYPFTIYGDHFYVKEANKGAFTAVYIGVSAAVITAGAVMANNK